MNKDIFDGIDIEEVARLLDDRSDVNAKDEDCDTTLMLAAVWGRADSARSLLDHGAEVNTKNKGGYTALMLAALFGHTDVVQLLLERGAAVTARNREENTALIYAAMAGHDDVVKLLLKYSADFYDDEEAKCASWAASSLGRTEVVKLIEEHRANLEKQQD